MGLLFFAVFAFVFNINCYAKPGYKNSNSYFNKQTIKRQGKWENKKQIIKPKRKHYKSGNGPTYAETKMVALYFILSLIERDFSKPVQVFSRPCLPAQCNDQLN